MTHIKFRKNKTEKRYMNVSEINGSDYLKIDSNFSKEEVVQLVAFLIDKFNLVEDIIESDDSDVIN